MKKKLSLLMIGFVMPITSLVLVSCGVKELNVPKTEIVAVYMHDVGQYSAGSFITNPDGSTTILITRVGDPTARIPVKIIPDVKSGEPMWYSCNGTQETFSGNLSEGAHCEIHVHSVDDINTAGWNNGKFGSGTTTRIN